MAASLGVVSQACMSNIPTVTVRLSWLLPLRLCVCLCVSVSGLTCVSAQMCSHGQGEECKLQITW